MRCPYCRQDIRVSGRFCPRCGRQIFGLPNAPHGQEGARFQPPLGPRASAGPQIAQPQEQAATPDVVGKTCPFDTFPISQSDMVIICPACGVPHHSDCWTENGGCTTYGCAQSPSSGPSAHVVASAAAGGHPAGYHPPVGPYRRQTPDPNQPVMTVMAAELDRNATNALLWAIIGLPCCAVPSIIGFFMALAVFASIGRMGIDSPGARQKAIWATVIGAVAPVIWAVGLIAFSQETSGY